MNPGDLGLIRLEMRQGRISLCMTAQFLGTDLCVTLSGGDRPHLGAVAVHAPIAGPLGSLELPGHREGPLALEIASRLAGQLQVTVSVACGIHLDAIRPEELEAVHELSGQLVDSLLERLGPTTP